MKKLFLIFLVISQHAVAQDSVELTIYFNDGSAVPPMPQMALLHDIAQHPNADQLRFWIVGHTDDKGSKQFNEALSQKRAQSVAHHLLRSGIKPYNILFEHKGEECPVTTNTNDAARANNRRVEVLISNVGTLDDTGFAARYAPDVFNPPFPNLSPHTEVFKLNALEPHYLTTQNGTQIHVPAMAFMNAYGRPVGGEVQLMLQEIHRPLNLFLSGISTKRDACNPQSHTETAGLLYVCATHRGKTVELMPHKALHIQLASTSLDTNFNLLFLNPSTQLWDSITVAAINTADARLIAVAENTSPAVHAYLRQTDYLSPAKASRTTLEARFKNMEYLANRPIASYYRFLRNGDENEKRAFDKLWKKSASLRAKVLLPHKNNTEETIHFTVRKQFQFEQHPAYFFFNFYTWEYAGNLSRKQLRKHIDNKRFHDIRVRFDAEKDSVSLELKGLNEIVLLPVKKVTIKNMSAELQKRMLGEFSPSFKAWHTQKSHRAFEKRYAMYAAVLEHQEKKISQKADRFESKALRRYKKGLRKAWKASQRFMNDWELTLSQQEWAAHCTTISNTLDNYDARKKNGTTIRPLVVSKLGIYNCARAIDRSGLQKITPRFICANGAAIEWEKCYVFDENINSVLSYHAVEGPTIDLNPSSIKMMVVTDKAGRIYQLNETEVLAMNRGKVTQRILHITEFNQAIQSPDEMRELLGVVGKN